MKLKTALLVAACAAFTINSTQAMLELRLNTTTQEFALFGSDTGTPADVLGGLTTFRLIPLGGSGSGNVSYNNDVAFSTDVGIPGNSFYGFDTNLAIDTYSGGIVFIQFGTSSSATQTITGNEVFQAYGSLPADVIARLESTIGQSLSLSEGTGFSAISVTAVPEPATYAALGGLAALGFVMLRRRLTAKQSA